MPDHQDEPPDIQAAAPKWRRLFKAGRSQLIMAVALCLVAGATATQIKATAATSTYSSLRRTDLVQMLDDLQAESRRQQEEIDALEDTKRQLESGADSMRVAREEAQRRLDEAQVLGGSVAATGPGITMVITAPEGNVTADMMLEAIQELRDAGAEAIEFNDSVRLVAQSWVGRAGDTLVVDGRKVMLPITIDAIGDPHSLEEGARFRGGIVSQLEADKVKGSVTITQSQSVEVTALHEGPTPRYSRPA